MGVSNDRVSGTVEIDRSICGIDENRRPGEAERPFWTDLPVDAGPVQVSHGTVLVRSEAQAHDVEVTLETGAELSEPLGAEFELLGEWPYRSGSGDLVVCTIEGPEFSFAVPADSRFLLRVFRSGGATVAARFDELTGHQYPITGLEAYHFLFVPQA
ncbi:Haze protective factor 1 [Streptomyces sp. 142MFCol3.1]|uniref:Haze protective factor 1 n=1 Tax=Streptomyces sp. 142MFCol3.1 TaxID=1172179 RepID=UPI00131A4143|nr:Haze protective factor 1 [Streptomyces sp. 142MFCol3.1]